MVCYLKPLKPFPMLKDNVMMLESLDHHPKCTKFTKNLLSLVVAVTYGQNRLEPRLEGSQNSEPEPSSPLSRMTGLRPGPA